MTFNIAFDLNWLVSAGSAQSPAECVETFNLDQTHPDFIIMPGVTNCFSCSLSNPSWAVEIGGVNIPVPTTTHLTVGTTTIIARNGYVVLSMPQLYVLAGNVGRRDLVCMDLAGTEYREARLVSPRELKFLLQFISHISHLCSPPPPTELTPPVFANIKVLEGDELILNCGNTVPASIGRLQILDPSGMVVGSTKYQVQNVSRTNAGTYSCIVSSVLPNNTNSLTVTAEVILECKSPPHLYVHVTVV